MDLGDKVAMALERIGITPSLVEEWLGEECGCEERKEKLNQLGRWASRIISGRAAKAAEYLLSIIGAHPKESDHEQSDGRKPGE